jgi:hypothetical protein
MWLLLRKPDDWVNTDRLESFSTCYLPKFELFIHALEKEECALGLSNTSKALLVLMRQSINDGTFWFNLAARRSYGIYTIYWQCFDKLHYGPRQSFEDRVGYLGLETQRKMEEFVASKMLQEMNID